MKLIKKTLLLALCVILLLNLFAPVASAKSNEVRTKDGWIFKDMFGCPKGKGYYVGKAKKVTIPANVVRLMSLSDTVQEVYIPAKTIYLDCSYHTYYHDYPNGLSTAKNLKRITVSSSNKEFVSKDGILFSKDLGKR